MKLEDFSEFIGAPFYCPNESCDFIEYNYRVVNSRLKWKCPKCGTGLKKRPVIPPDFGHAKEFWIACPDCANFHRTTICTGFGAKIEGICTAYIMTGCSYDTSCDGIIYNDEYKALELARFLASLPRSFVDKAMEMLPGEVPCATCGHPRRVHVDGGCSETSRVPGTFNEIACKCEKFISTERTEMTRDPETRDGNLSIWKFTFTRSVSRPPHEISLVIVAETESEAVAFAKEFVSDDTFNFERYFRDVIGVAAKGQKRGIV